MRKLESRADRAPRILEPSAARSGTPDRARLPGPKILRLAAFVVASTPGIRQVHCSITAPRAERSGGGDAGFVVRKSERRAQIDNEPRAPKMAAGTSPMSVQPATEPLCAGSALHCDHQRDRRPLPATLARRDPACQLPAAPRQWSAASTFLDEMNGAFRGGSRRLDVPPAHPHIEPGDRDVLVRRRGSSTVTALVPAAADSPGRHQLDNWPVAEIRSFRRAAAEQQAGVAGCAVCRLSGALPPVPREPGRVLPPSRREPSTARGRRDMPAESSRGLGTIRRRRHPCRRCPHCSTSKRRCPPEALPPADRAPRSARSYVVDGAVRLRRRSATEAGSGNAQCPAPPWRSALFGGADRSCSAVRRWTVGGASTGALRVPSSRERSRAGQT
mgnify:CR=1 FL=1